MLQVHHIACVPDSGRDLISIGALEQAGESFTIGQGTLNMNNSNLEVRRKNNTYPSIAQRISPETSDNHSNLVNAATVRPGNNYPRIIDINHFHQAYNHSNERIL